MALLTCCQHTFQNFSGYEDSIDELKSVADVLVKEVNQTSAEIIKTSEQINSTVEMVKTKVDGSTVEELERRVTDVEQDANGMQITISSVSAAVDKQEQDFENYKWLENYQNAFLYHSFLYFMRTLIPSNVLHQHTYAFDYISHRPLWYRWCPEIVVIDVR